MHYKTGANRYANDALLTKRPVILLFLITLVAILLIGAPGRAKYEYIDINNPFLRKIPLAIPLCVSVSDSDTDEIVLREATEILEEMLDFTGYFEMIDRGAFLVDPQNPAIAGAEINFKNWMSVGAELLITSGISQKGDTIEIELRLFDAFKGRRFVGKSYRGKVKDLRNMIRRFCSEVIYQLTGNRGIFNSKIAFVSTTTGAKEIYICDFDGRSPLQFTYGEKISFFPAWSTDGKWIAYTSYENGKPDIYIKHLYKKDHNAVIDKKGLNITPAWVPGKFVLAATLSFSGDQEIYLLTGRGKIIKRLTNKWGSDLSPAWSPDGKKMAFVSSRSGSPQIYVKELASRRVQRLTFQGRYNTQPNWSPRGDTIVYTSIQDGQSNIFVIGLDDQEPVQLTYDAGDNEAPSWSPDGSLIAFSSTREGSSRIYIMTAYGTDQRRLLFMPGEQTNPSWSPSITKN
jgi:TolB protein